MDWINKFCRNWYQRLEYNNHTFIFLLANSNIPTANPSILLLHLVCIIRAVCLESKSVVTACALFHNFTVAFSDERNHFQMRNQIQVAYFSLFGFLSMTYHYHQKTLSISSGHKHIFAIASDTVRSSFALQSV